MKIVKITPQIAAMYIGQKCENSAGSIYTVANTDIFCFGEDAEPWRKLTLHLRRLESITEQEARDVYKAVKGKEFEEQPYKKCPEIILHCKKDWFDKEVRPAYGVPAAWLYLLSKGFDLFDLIDNNLAKEIKNDSIS